MVTEFDIVPSESSLNMDSVASSTSSWAILNSSNFGDIGLINSPSISGQSVETSGSLDSCFLNLAQDPLLGMCSNSPFSTRRSRSSSWHNDSLRSMSMDEKECLITEVLDKFDYSFEPNEQSTTYTFASSPEIFRSCSGYISLYKFPLRSWQSDRLTLDTAVSKQLPGHIFPYISKRQIADAVWFMAGAVVTVAALGTSLLDTNDPLLCCGSM